MQTAASDFTVGDMVAAGAAYAVTRAAAGHPQADDLKAGRIKVDEMPLTQNRLAASRFTPTATGGVGKRRRDLLSGIRRLTSRICSTAQSSSTSSLTPSQDKAQHEARGW